MRLVEEAERKERPVESITMPYAPVARSLLRIGWCSDCYTVVFLSAPPVLAACPAARCVAEARPQPGRPRSGCAAGPFAPRGSHGAWKSTGAAMGAYRTRLHRGSGSPQGGLPPHVRVQPRTACAHGLMQGESAPCQPRVAPVQRRAPSARPSGVLLLVGRPHAPGQPPSAGGADFSEGALRDAYALPAALAIATIPSTTSRSQSATPVASASSRAPCVK